MSSITFHGTNDFGQIPWSAGTFYGPIGVNTEGNIQNTLPDTDGSRYTGVYSGGIPVFEDDELRPGLKTIKLETGQYLELSTQLPVAIGDDTYPFEVEAYWRPSANTGDAGKRISAYGYMGPWDIGVHIMTYPPPPSGYAAWGFFEEQAGIYGGSCLDVYESGSSVITTHNHSITTARKISFRRFLTNKVGVLVYNGWAAGVWNYVDGKSSTGSLVVPAAMRICGWSGSTIADDRYLKVQAIATRKWNGYAGPHSFSWISPDIKCPGGVTSIAVAGKDVEAGANLSSRIYYKASHEDNLDTISEWTPLTSSVIDCDFLRIAYIGTIDTREILVYGENSNNIVTISDETKELISIRVSGPGIANEWGGTKLPETWTLAACRACMRNRLKYDGDPSLITDADLDVLALEAQRIIMEKLRWPTEVVTLTHGAMTALHGTPVRISTAYETCIPPMYPTGIDLTDITQDVTVEYIPDPDYLCLPEPLWQAICALGASLWLQQVDAPRREENYRAFAMDRVTSFKRQLHGNAFAQTNANKTRYGINT